MKYICVQPKLIYYVWQLEVMLNNFIKNGISPADIQIIIVEPEKEDELSHWAGQFLKRLEEYSQAKFYRYQDTRVSKTYVSSIRPNALKQHFQKYPELEKEIIFYHDCDMIFTKPVNFDNLLNDNTWYISNTISYICASYIQSKGRNILEKMSDIVGIDKQIVIDNEYNSGGAQYIIKNVNYQFWSKVEQDCEKLYSFFLEDEKLHHKEEKINYHAIQKWTADMWAVLWNAWYFKYDVKIHEDMDFAWATDEITIWDETKIYHNAGVNDDTRDLFWKGRWQNKFPYFYEENINPNFCSYNYYKEMKSIKTCLI